MTCRHCIDAEKLFGARAARRELRRYRRKGTAGATRALLEAILREDVSGASVLDVGGGVGVLQHELLAAGAASTLGVDAAAAYIDAAREEGGRRQVAERMAFRHGDFVDVADDVPAADIVTLDKVICCYPDMERLVALSAARARRLYGLVFPRETTLVRLGLALANLYFRARRRAFRTYVHPSAEVDRVVRSAGLEPRFRENAGPVWQVVLYARPLTA
jgi:magnesium-protoporphyrin O-methyltransferase